MKKNQRFFAFASALTLLVGSIYAADKLTTPQNPTSLLKQINVAAFEMKPISGTPRVAVVEQTLAAQKGITSYAVNPSSNIIAVTFYPDETTEAQILAAIQSSDNSMDVSKKIFEKVANGCPVDSPSAFWTYVKQLF